jgi:hypothetical protein
MKTLALLTALLGISITTVLAQTSPGADPAPTAQTNRPATPAQPETSADATAQREADILKELPEVPPDQVERYVTFQNRTLSRMFGMNLQYEGLLPQMGRSDRPLQLLSPFAPLRYGDGFQNISVNPLTGRGEGINVFSIRF